MTGGRTLWSDLQADLRRIDGRARGPAGLVWMAARHKTFRAICSYRLARAARGGGVWRRPLRAAARLWHRWACLSIGVEISPDADIGPGFRVLHGFGLVILSCARIGRNVTMAHGACVGYRGTLEDPRTPVSVGAVGDACFVGPFAFVWAEIGAGCVVAPHSVVTAPAPPGCFLAGAPATVRRRGVGGYVAHPVPAAEAAPAHA